MEQYKREFIEFLKESGALKLNGDFKTKAGRNSPYFFNLGDLSDAESTLKIAEAYAKALVNTNIDFDILYGIPEKGVGFVAQTIVEFLKQTEKNKSWAFSRKIPKEYGELTTSKSQIVGRKPQEGERIITLDDVITTGETKYEALATLNKEAQNLKFPSMLIALDRQEINILGKDASEEFKERTNIPIISIINAGEVYKYLKENDNENARRIANYLRVYGTNQAKETLEKPLEKKIIGIEKSIIVACDVEEKEQFEKIVKETAEFPYISGYKIGFELGYGGKGWGLADIVEIAKTYAPNKAVIFDHQKAATDIPDTGKNFARKMKKSGIETIILFPQAGPETERSWIYHALDYDLNIIVGGRMTHQAYAVSEGGFITDEGAKEMYKIAAKAGVKDFVVPGNKPEVIQEIKEVIETEGVSPIFYSPGFINQGGNITQATQVAGKSWHAIIGRGIIHAKDIKKAVQEYTSQLAWIDPTTKC